MIDRWSVNTSSFKILNSQPSTFNLALPLTSFLLLFPTSPIPAQYFQQQVDHVIEVRLDDEAHLLHAQQSFTYHNNSPVALDTIWMHLWPNAYHDRSTALCKQMDEMGDFSLHFARKEEWGYIDSLDFALGPNKLQWGLHEVHSDIGWIKLPMPLVPGEHVSIDTPFRVKVPSGRFSRLGHTEQAYYITQWYPKPAVFDKNGWHTMPYLTQGEFYSEFGRFEVKITLPRNYVVASTGELQEENEMKWLNDRASGHGEIPLDNSFPPSSEETKTITYVQDHIHDFAWFADKRFLVQKGVAYLQRSDRDVVTWAMYTPKNAETWKDATTYVKESVELYSEWCGDYPYASCTAVDGTISAGGGMEYPMVTIIGNMEGPMMLDNVIAHEVGHNWFYGILASNERDHPWMDEGVNSFVEMRCMDTRYPDNPMGLRVPILGAVTRDMEPFHRLQNELMYRYNSRRDLDQAPDLHSTEFTPTNYGAMVYAKSALAFDQLFNYLGPEVFDACMIAYFSEWKFKHPSPEDMRASFERTSGEDLGWLFDGLLGSCEKYDPKDPADARKVIDIDARNDRSSNTKPRLKFLTGLEHSNYRDTYWTPALAWGAADGLMLGGVVHNHGFPSKRNEYVIAPFYGGQSGELIGGARFMHHTDRLRSGLFQNIHLGVNARRASLIQNDVRQTEYTKIAPEIIFDLKPRHLHRSPKQSIQLRYVYLYEQVRTPFDDVTLVLGNNFSSDRHAQDITYTIERKIGLNPWQVSVTSLHHEEMIRASLTAEGSTIFNGHGHRATLRLFAGKIFSENIVPAAAWRTSGVTGANDLLYDRVLPGRTEPRGLAAQHFYADQGGFRTPTSLGRSDDLLLSANLVVDAPFKIPLMAFANGSLAPVTTIEPNGRSTSYRSLYEAGIGIRMIRDMFEIWVPLTYSADIRDEFEFREVEFTDRIRFTLAIHKLDPTRILRNLAP